MSSYLSSLGPRLPESTTPRMRELKQSIHDKQAEIAERALEQQLRALERQCWPQAKWTAQCALLDYAEVFSWNFMRVAKTPDEVSSRGRALLALARAPDFVRQVAAAAGLPFAADLRERTLPMVTERTLLRRFSIGIRRSQAKSIGECVSLQEQIERQLSLEHRSTDSEPTMADIAAWTPAHDAEASTWSPEHPAGGGIVYKTTTDEP